MLVTDGSQDNYKDVFEKYNWDNLPIVTVRLFTYLVGREVSDPRDVKWMACANQGLTFFQFVPGFNMNKLTFQDIMCT